MDILKQPKYSALTGVFYLLIAVYITGYAIASKNNAFDKSGFYHDRNFTVSNAIGNGEKEAVATLSFIGALIIIYSLYKTNIYPNNNVKYIMMFSILLIGSLFVSIIYINPLIQNLSKEKIDDYDKKHPILAGVAFLIVLLYVAANSYFMVSRDKNMNTKLILGGIVLLNIAAFITCIVSTLEKNRWGYDITNANKVKTAGILFEISENVQLLCLLTIITYVGLRTSGSSTSSSSPLIYGLK